MNREDNDMKTEVLAAVQSWKFVFWPTSSRTDQEILIALDSRQSEHYFRVRCILSQAHLLGACIFRPLSQFPDLTYAVARVLKKARAIWSTSLKTTNTHTHSHTHPRTHARTHTHTHTKKEQDITEMEVWFTTHVTRLCYYYWSLLYSAVLRSWTDTLRFTSF